MSDVRIVTREEFLKALEAEEAKLKGAYTTNELSDLGANWFTCTACRAAIQGTLAAAIGAALAGASAAIGIIAGALALTVDIVTGIIAEVISASLPDAVSQVVLRLCKAMRACE